MIRVPVGMMKEILYFLNEWLRIMSLGGQSPEYRRLSRLVWSLYKVGCLPTTLREYPQINYAVQNFERIERIENQK